MSVNSSNKSGAFLFEPVPSLQALVAAHGLNPRNLTVAFQVDGQGNIKVAQKNSIPINDGGEIVHWEVPALAGLFRGQAVPPADIEHYPAAYVLHFDQDFV